MSSKLTLVTLNSMANQAGFLTQLNANFTALADKLDTFVSRDGDEPNQMTAPLDMNSQRLINLPNATSDHEPATFKQLQDIVASTNGVIYNPETWTLSGDGVTTVFSIPGATISSASAYRVSIAGVLKNPELDYSVNPTTDVITFTVAPASGTNNISVVSTGYAKPVAEGAVGAGAVGSTELANSAVITTKINNGAVTSDKLATDSVTTIKILDENVTAAKLAAILNLTGKTVTVATQTANDNSTKAASTAYADAAAAAAIAGFSGRSSPIRQTVLSGPVNSSGHASFGGSTGGTTVTMSGTLIVSAANGYGSDGAVNRIGSISNASWTGLSTNGTMYLYVDVASDGTCTTGSTTVRPVYQWGGTYSTTNNQFTFNIQEMVGKVGNGSIATQTYRVFVGEVTVASNVVSVISWYQPCGRYCSAASAFGATSATHNLGVTPRVARAIAICRVATGAWSVGDEVEVQTSTYYGGGWGYSNAPVSRTRTTVTMAVSNYGTHAANPGLTTQIALTSANFDVRLEAERGW